MRLFSILSIYKRPVLLLWKLIRRRCVIRPIVWLDERNVDRKLPASSCFAEIYEPNFGNGEKKIYLDVPDIYIYKLESVWGSTNSSSFFDNNNIYVERYDYGRLHERYISGHLLLHTKDSALVIRSDNKIILKEKVIFLAGNGAFNYFHWIVEILPRILDFFRDGGEGLKIDAIVVNKKVKEYSTFQEALDIFLEHMDVKLPIYYIDQSDLVLFDTVYYISPRNHVLFDFNCGEPLLDYSYFSLDVLKKIRDIVFSSSNYINLNSKKKFPEKFFILRGKGIGTHNTRNYNESDIFGVSEKYGFEGVYIEDYSFVEQAYLFSNAKSIAAPSGAFLSNLIFIGDEAAVISWLPESISKFSVYSSIGRLMGAKMRFILATPKEEGLHAEYYLDPKSFEELLRV